MKKLIIPVLTGIGLCLAQMAAQAQEFKEHISKQFTLQKPAAETVAGIYNIFGSIKVEGYSGNQVLIEIDKTITADSQEQIEKGGFLLAHWDGTSETEEAIKEATKATIRCIPFDQEAEEGVCIFSGKPSTGRVVFARAY